MFYDHFLAKNWTDYSHMPLEEFADNFYCMLEKSSYCLADKLTKRMSFMIEGNWLLSYKEIEGIEISLDRISKRFLKLNHTLLNPIDELTRNYKDFESDFKSFFPSAIEYANILKNIYKK